VICPTCACETRVLESRLADGGEAVRRRRECLQCGTRHTTFERVEEPVLWVRKRDGRRQPFDRPKLLRGLARAIAKRPIALEDVERLSFEVEAELRACGHAEVESALIGDAALRLLALLDGVAYVRFASVYRQFDDPAEFQRELELYDADRTSVR
jgi:transcriptional repressor NrdR